MAVPVSIDEVLLRGCTLRNSGAVAGLVVYTGAEARIQMNAAAPPRKRGELPGSPQPAGSVTRAVYLQPAGWCISRLEAC